MHFFVSKSAPGSRQYKDAYFDRKPFSHAIFIVIVRFMGISLSLWGIRWIYGGDR